LYYSQGATYMIPAGYFVTISFAASTKPVIFVHGWSAPFNSNNFDGLLSQLSSQIGSPVGRFAYYQDLGSAQGGSCASRSAVIPQQPDGGMPVDLGSIDSTICDSSSAIGLNAVLLDQDVRNAFMTTDQPVVLVANSMGAAIVRGFLAYSAERNDGVAAQMTDSVFFLEGAQDGAYAAFVTKLSGALSPIEQGLQQFGVLAGVPNVSRPAGKDLTPASDWYEWTNPPASHLPALAYFNAFGDISIVTQECLFFGNVCFDVPIPSPSVGDVALLPGTDDPTDAPILGGARFLAGSPGAQNWQWTMAATAHWKPWTDPFFVGAIQEAASTAVFHGNFGAQMHSITVPDCRTGQPTAFDDELARVVVERVNGLSNNCTP
ncbi:MAG: hypothetical protein WCG47_28415, partial [Dermatophilaceae bacterium]